MAFAKERTKKDGTKFYEISAYYCGNDEEKKKKAPRRYTRYYYPPRGWSARSIKKALNDEIAEFQRAVDAGEVLSKAERKEKEEREKAEAAAAAAERALLKTVRQYVEDVFMPEKLQSIAENTRISFQSNFDNHIFPVIGDTLMKDVTSAMITTLMFDFRKDHSYTSAIKVFNILHALFNMAVFDDTIPFSPMSKVSRPRQKKDERAVTEADKALFEDELLYVLDCVEQEPIMWQAFMYLAADTGCRRGELCGLQWSDIDWKKKTVTIKHNLQYSKSKGGIYNATPKGGEFRTVDLGEDTIAVLQKYKDALIKTDDVVDINEYREQKKKLPKWIFTKDGTSEPMLPYKPTKYFKAFGEKYNVPGFHPHMLRHTSATLSLINGGDTKSVADRLGHKDASVTLRMYAHANDESIRAAGQAARDALRRKKEERQKEKKTGA